MDPILFLKQDVIKLILGFIVGGIIGLERQFLVVKRVGMDKEEAEAEARPGVRTFGLFSLTGVLAVFISGEYTYYLFLFSIAGALAILIVWTASRAYYFKDLGITTSIALVISFIVGVLIGLGDIVLGITISVFVTFLLSVKENVKNLIKGLEYKEIASALQIGILVLLLFPIIPNMRDPLFGVINFRSLFFFLVLILSASFFSYVIVKRLGIKQGLPTFAALGALVNSETVTTNLAKFSKADKKEHNKLISNSVLLANLVMIARILSLSILFALDRVHFIVNLTSILGPVLIIGIILVSYRYLKGGEKVIEEIDLESPLAYKTAFKFVGTFAIVSFAMVALQQAGEWGYLLAALIGGFLSNTAILFSAISSLQAGLLSIREAIIMISLGTVSAITNKLIYAKAGGANKLIVTRIAIDIIILVSFLLFFVCWISSFFLII